jgi:tagatose-1,6-bisphosphate aldolase non-catalytic subunit AgaZ/GatZ
MVFDKMKFLFQALLEIHYDMNGYRDRVRDVWESDYIQTNDENLAKKFAKARWPKAICIKMSKE